MPLMPAKQMLATLFTAAAGTLTAQITAMPDDQIEKFTKNHLCLKSKEQCYMDADSSIITISESHHPSHVMFDDLNGNGRYDPKRGETITSFKMINSAHVKRTLNNQNIGFSDYTFATVTRNADGSFSVQNDGEIIFCSILNFIENTYVVPASYFQDNFQTLSQSLSNSTQIDIHALVGAIKSVKLGLGD